MIPHSVASPHAVYGLLQSLIKKKDLVGARDLYSLVTMRGLELNAFLGTHFIGMFILCGESLSEDSTWIFKKIPDRSPWTWSLSIDAFVKTGQNREAMKLFQSMDLQPNSFVLVSVLKACIHVEDGMLIHAYIVDIGMEIDVHVGNTLIGMYGNLSSIHDASSVFKNTSNKKDIVAWNAIISAFLHNGHGPEAIKYYVYLQRSGNVRPNSVTFVSLLKACSESAPNQTKFVHICIIKNGFESNAYIGSMLIDIYAKRGNLEDAQRTFERLSKEDVATWNSMITGFISCEHFEEALQLFTQLPKHNVKPNNLTLVAIMQACSDIFVLDGGRLIHSYIIRNNITLNTFISSSLIDMYTRCGGLEDAQNIFDNLYRKDVISWNAMMAGYTQHGLGWEALCLFSKMCRYQCCKPDEVTFVIASKACSITTMLESGRCIHSHIVEAGHESPTVINNTLIYMYSTCGNIQDACHVFKRMSSHDTWTWNAMISGISENGEYNLASDYFRKMREGGVDPIYVTFVPMLSLCSQQGLLDEGCSLFRSAREYDGVPPTVELYNCMVDVLGRVGYLHLAEEILLTIPFEFNLLGWMSLLTNCKTHNNIEVGKRFFDDLVNFSAVKKLNEISTWKKKPTAHLTNS